MSCTLCPQNLEESLNCIKDEVFIDDGFSGTNQNRPAFQRMMTDVKQGFINTILIKDLSRLGRNYLEVGNLAEVFLPEHGCELISLNEKLDDMMVFRNWFNEQHSKSTSVKVRASRRVCAENGKYLGTYAPYGYKKDPGNRHSLAIDEATAPTARRIFEMRASGMGFRAIAIQLNEEGITSPREYYYQGKERKNPCKTNRSWSETSIKDMIKNEVYIGNTVQCKVGTVSYKNHKLVDKPKDDWIRVEATHEPIVSRDLWDRVQAFMHKNYRPRRRNDGERNLFTGLLYCADCGFKLRGQVERSKRKDGSEYKYVSYMCGTYAHSGKDACTIHSVNEQSLISLVAEHIRSHAVMIAYDESHIIDAIITAQCNEAAAGQAVYKGELETNKKQIAKLDLLIDSLCEDKASGLIPDSLFKRQIQKYEKDRIERSQAVKALEKRINSFKQNNDNAAVWTQLMKQYRELETLDSETLFLLIDKIVIGEAQQINGRRVCDIKILYNYVGDVDELGLTAGRAENTSLVYATGAGRTESALLAYATGVVTDDRKAI